MWNNLLSTDNMILEFQFNDIFGENLISTVLINLIPSHIHIVSQIFVVKDYPTGTIQLKKESI